MIQGSNIISRSHDGIAQFLGLRGHGLGSAGSVVVQCFRSRQHIGINADRRFCYGYLLAKLHCRIINDNGGNVSRVVVWSHKVPNELAIRLLFVSILIVTEVKTSVLLRLVHTQKGCRIIGSGESGILVGKTYLIGTIALGNKGVLVIGLAFLCVVCINGAEVVKEHIPPTVFHPAFQHITADVIRVRFGALLYFDFVA